MRRELLLIDACQQYGLGNWMDIAEHIGSFRTKEDVERHYHFTYLQSPDFPYPVRFALLGLTILAYTLVNAGH